MTHIMVDLETWGLTPGSDIRSIGAVVFDPVAGTLGDEFYVNVVSGNTLGLTRDPDTEKWWLDQSASAQDALAVKPVNIAVGLARFGDWLDWLPGGACAPGPELRLWAHGSHFDEPILAAAYRAAKMTCPWHYRAPRDTRTIYEAAGGVDLPFEGTPHNALHDAKHQARCVIEAYRKLKLAHDLNIPFRLWPENRDSPMVAALKKAGRQIRQMDKDKAWISNDVAETLNMIDIALQESVA